MVKKDNTYRQCIDLKNIGVAVEKLQLSCIHAELLVFPVAIGLYNIIK